MTTTKRAQDLADDTVIMNNQPYAVIQVLRDSPAYMTIWVDGPEDEPRPINCSHDFEFTAMLENETWCEEHGVVIVESSGSTPGFCAGDVYWANFSCGCQYVEDCSYLED